MNEIGNAFSILEGLRQSRGHDSIVLEDKIDLTLENGEAVTPRSLLAKTWWLINRQFKDGQQDVLKKSIVRAIGQCIEDDGRRVKEIKKLEKIISVLQTDIERLKTEGINIMPEPDSFLSAFFTPKKQEMMSAMERTREEKKAYGHQLLEAIKVAVEDIYKDAPDKRREVDEKASNFLRVSLEF